MQNIFDKVTDGISSHSNENECVNNDARRLFHGRGHCYDTLEFVTVDWFSPLLLVSFFKAPEEEWLDSFKRRFVEFNDEESIESIVFQYRYLPGSPCEMLKGTIPEILNAHEGGLDFRLAIGKNQNVGFFLDMKNCRQWLKEEAAGKKILNLFSYTCAFSVVASSAGAKTVVNMDMAKGALSTGKINHKINNLDTQSIFFFAHDIFKSWGKIRKYGPYDCIVVDPPSFQRGSFDARKDYIKIVNKLPELLATGGLVMACLNSPELDFGFLRELFDRVGGFEEQRVIPVPDSFPEIDKNKGLKTVIFKKVS